MVREWKDRPITEQTVIDLHELLPDVWLDRHPEHCWQIAALRAQERTAKGSL